MAYLCYLSCDMMFTHIYSFLYIYIGSAIISHYNTECFQGINILHAHIIIKLPMWFSLKKYMTSNHTFRFRYFKFKSPLYRIVNTLSIRPCRPATVEENNVITSVNPKFGKLTIFCPGCKHENTIIKILKKYGDKTLSCRVPLVTENDGANGRVTEQIHTHTNN